ncbi:aminopeptidase [Blastopirellula marina]|uniref:Aminopeptidase n=1 Tax=Blastopirellula marina TaxID=124 RepID=A0A2S8FND0_9BACT|nr:MULTISPECIES: DUF4910 domain-containing protein [Pirellulaceae]PQO33490.1 aminopeptidase [Blastopirellula marina]RCS52581.1 DUF4910 domain-containing protein [Bremerella cremea]
MNYLGKPLPNGDLIYQLAEQLFPICRSITGNGVRETLGILQQEIPELQVHEIPTGTPCFDWTIPKEWNIRDAWICDPSGEKIVDFKRSNLHVMGYSVPVDQRMSLDELQSHLYSVPEQPNAIPYVTSYYKERWGFCLTDHQRKGLKPGEYHVKIDSELTQGSLSYGEISLPGSSDQEVFLSTYVCHPSMGNNELSGPCVATFLAKWIKELHSRRYRYRIVFIPETIGSIAYLSLHKEEMQKGVIAGFNISCVGDNRDYSFLPSRAGNTVADRVGQHVLRHMAPDYKQYTFLDRGSDERQYCSPGIDLPVASVMRTKYGMYPEYHTSLDDLSLISPEGLFGGYMALIRCLEVLEQDCVPKATTPCEPQLGKRGLYPDLSMKGSANHVRQMMNLLAYSDGTKSLLEIGEIIDAPAWELRKHVDNLAAEGLLEYD